MATAGKAPRSRGGPHRVLGELDFAHRRLSKSVEQNSAQRDAAPGGSPLVFQHIFELRRKTPTELAQAKF